MKTISDEPAFATPPPYGQYGLTKLEYFAAMAMQGLLSGNYKYFDGNDNVPVTKIIAEEAVANATALINELNK